MVFFVMAPDCRRGFVPQRAQRAQPAHVSGTNPTPNASTLLTQPANHAMFQALKDLLEGLTPFNPTPSPAERARSVQLAAAVLLVEVVRAKAALGDAERSVMVSALRQQFALSDEELQALLDQATTTSRTAYDYQHFTSQLNEHFTQAEKIRLVEAMWQVAYADALPDENEMHTISKVAGLLHVTHGEYIGAKMRAKEVSPP